MRYPPHLLDEIRARLNVSDVVGRKVALKKKGREYAGLSPFKSEKTASFFVNDQKGFYHCFASGEHGDIFSFLMKTEGLTFPEAIERLAEEAGVELPKKQAANPERQDERKRLIELLECAAAYFEAQLKTSAARHARNYLERRQLQAETIATFRMGYAPASRTALSQHLRQAGFSAKEIVTSGMQIAGEDIREPYDRFRERIMFPIADTRGRIVAFGGRALDANQPAKYLNSPETPVFHKGHLLYNAHRARPAAHDAGALIVVEGYMDVIALAQAGFTHAVAPLGTALSGDQIQLLWRMCAEPTLCFDGDSAGKRAAYRAIDTVLPHLKAGHSLHFAFLPSGADPDDIVREQGANAFTDVLQRAHPLADTLWEREWESGSWTTPERRAKLENQLRKLVLSIADPAVRGHYGRIIAEKLSAAWRPSAPNYTAQRTGPRPYGGGGGIDRRSGARRGNAKQGARFGGITPSHSSSLKKSSFVAPGTASHKYREALLLRTLATHPWLIEEVAEELAALDFRTAAFAQLRDALLNACADEKNLDTLTLRNHLEASGYAPNLEQTERMATNKCHAFAEPDADRVTVENGWRHTLSLHQQQSLRDQLSEAEREYSRNLDEDALARILELQRLIATIVPKEAVIE
ncbi:MAG: DNA primase [Hyphomicrobiaceae bacterium]